MNGLNQRRGIVVDNIYKVMTVPMETAGRRKDERLGRKLENPFLQVKVSIFGMLQKG
jgi:hypothetical protein